LWYEHVVAVAVEVIICLKYHKIVKNKYLKGYSGMKGQRREQFIPLTRDLTEFKKKQTKELDIGI